MSDPTTAKTTTPKPTATAAPVAGQTVTDAGQAELQAAADKEQEQGFVGTEVDQTPNENYTLKGVTSGAPTPETERGKDDE